MKKDKENFSPELLKKIAVEETWHKRAVAYVRKKYLKAKNGVGLDSDVLTHKQNAAIRDYKNGAIDFKEMALNKLFEEVGKLKNENGIKVPGVYEAIRLIKELEADENFVHYQKSK